MPRGTLTDEGKKELEDRAAEWIKFREDFGFTQRLLADTLTSIDTAPTGKRKGISRRTIQQIEAGMIAPHKHTLDLFAKLRHRHESNKSA